MAERAWQPTDAELEQALADLHAHLVYPRAPQLADRVGERLRAEQAPAGRPARRVAWVPVHRVAPVPIRGLRRAVALALALALLSGGVLALSPGARTAVAEWLHLHGFGFIYVPSPPPLPPVGTHLQLGHRTTLAAAQAHVPFRILAPAPALGAPDEIYLAGPPPPGGQVALVYRARAGLPRAGGTGVGALLTEFRGDLRPERIFYMKGLGPGTRLEFVQVGRTPAYWITGQPHLFFYVTASGTTGAEQVRLAGNVLLWERAGLVLRLESALSKETALRIAASLR